MVLPIVCRQHSWILLTVADDSNYEERAKGLAINMDGLQNPRLVVNYLYNTKINDLTEIENNETTELAAMTDLNQIPEPLRPLWRPFLTTLGCFVVSMTCFSSWSDVLIPMAPEDLKVVRVSIDDVSYSSSVFNQGSRWGPGGGHQGDIQRLAWHHLRFLGHRLLR